MARTLREVRRASDDDLEDALDHMSDFSDHELSLDNFDVQVAIVQLEALDEYDDLSSWTEWDHGELAEMDEDDRFAELRSFRGSGWAKHAIEWTSRTVPPIVIVTLLDGSTAIADGRGRTNYAIGMGWDAMPATFLTERE